MRNTSSSKLQYIGKEERKRERERKGREGRGKERGRRKDGGRMEGGWRREERRRIEDLYDTHLFLLFQHFFIFLKCVTQANIMKTQNKDNYI